MTRDEAAGLLGVPVDADDDRVRAAFRSRARRAHPDRGGNREVDLAELARARDLLLETTGPAEQQPPGPAAPGRVTASTPRPQRATVRPAPAAARGAGALGRSLYALLGAVVALIVAGVAIVVAVAIATGNGDDADPDHDAEQCLVVAEAGVEPASCEAAGAQRIVAEYTGARTCPAGSNSLVVGSTTWCLEPAAP